MGASPSSFKDVLENFERRNLADGLKGALSRDTHCRARHSQPNLAARDVRLNFEKRNLAAGLNGTLSHTRVSTLQGNATNKPAKTNCVMFELGSP